MTASQTIWIRNKTLLFSQLSSQEYIRRTVDVLGKFQLSSKNAVCEANIYLNPFSQSQNPSMYTSGSLTCTNPCPVDSFVLKIDRYVLILDI